MVKGTPNHLQIAICLSMVKISLTMYILRESWDSGDYEYVQEKVEFGREKWNLTRYPFRSKMWFSDFCREISLFSHWDRIKCAILDIREPRCSRTGFYGFWRFMAVFRGFLRFLVPNPQIKNLKIDQKIDFPKIVPKHVLMANMVLKHV